ncbi:MAG: hypothetical protein OSB41_12650 [Kiritimatiellae bacterium]|nr:hypothetical protein [Kiritimatiellia bacterium]
MREALTFRKRSIQSRAWSSQRRRFGDLYAGSRVCGKAAAKKGFEVTTFEAFPDGQGFDRSQDLGDPRVVDLICDDVLEGRYCHVHAGIECKTWSVMQYSFGGSRSRDDPLGNGRREAEVTGNRQMQQLMRILLCCLATATDFTVENPQTSILWLVPLFVQILALPFVETAIIHQCAYGLGSPPGSSPVEVWKKPTRISGALHGLASLSRKCPGGHVHGDLGRRSLLTLASGKKVAKITLAASYPAPLVKSLIEIVGAAWCDGDPQPNRDC